MNIDTHRGNWDLYPVWRGRWQVFARWSNPGETPDGGIFAHYTASPAMSRRRCKRWVRMLAKRIKKGEVTT